MKYHNPVLVLMGLVIAMFFLTGIASCATTDDDAAAAIALAIALADSVPAAAKADPPCGKAGCDCGCREGGNCVCAFAKYKAGDRKNGYTYADDGYWYKDVPANQPVTVSARSYYFPSAHYAQPIPARHGPAPVVGFGGVRGCAGGG